MSASRPRGGRRLVRFVFPDFKPGHTFHLQSQPPKKHRVGFSPEECLFFVIEHSETGMEEIIQDFFFFFNA